MLECAGVGMSFSMERIMEERRDRGGGGGSEEGRMADTLVAIECYPLQNHPGSLWMIELMCWCWSEKPQHRPSFQEILKVLRNSTLVKLLSAFPATQSREVVTAAATKLSFESSPQHSPITEDTVDVLGNHGDFRARLEVWYGCDGQLNVVEYLPTGVTMQVNNGIMRGPLGSHEGDHWVVMRGITG